MESTDHARESERGSSNTLEFNVEELKKMKEELQRAKDNATESWLDSKPLIDELERLKSDLATAQNRCSLTNNQILERESQLQTIVKDVRSKRVEELRAAKMVNEMNRDLEQTRNELEQLKADKDEEHRARSKLKQTLRLRRQTLRTLQLTLRAVRIESEAFGASAAEALRYINHLESDNSPVELTQGDYYALKRRAKEETSLADWRVSVALEQKDTAEAARNLALRRLKETHLDNRSKRRKAMEKILVDEEAKQEEPEDQDLSKQGVEEVLDRGSAFPKARAKEIVEYKQGKPRWKSKSRKKNEFKKKKKKKVSFLFHIKSCLVRIKGLFK